MTKTVLGLLQRDLSKRWSLFTWVCIVGCGVSLAVLKFRGNLFIRKGNFGQVDFLSLCTLALCFLAGLVALTRKGTSRIVPGAALLVTILLGRLEILGGLMALAEIPFLLLAAFIKHPIGLFLGVLFAIALASIAKRREARRLVPALGEFFRRESRRPIGRASLVGGIVFITMTFLLKEWGLPFFLYGLFFRSLSWLWVRALLCGAVLVVSFFFAMSPFWRRGENQLVSLVVISAILVMFIRQLVAAFLLGAWLLMFPIIGLFLIVGLFLVVRQFWRSAIRS